MLLLLLRLPGVTIVACILPLHGVLRLRHIMMRLHVLLRRVLGGVAILMVVLRWWRWHMLVGVEIRIVPSLIGILMPHVHWRGMEFLWVGAFINPGFPPC